MIQYGFIKRLITTCTILLIWLATSCIPQDEIKFESTIETSQNTDTSTITPSPKSTFSPTIILKPMHSETSIPEATNLSEVSSSTLTASPTLSFEEASAFVDELYQTNNGCLLPCWWGIEPGETTWQDAKTFLSQFTQITGGVNPDDNSLMVHYVQIPRSVDGHIEFATDIYLVRNDTVKTIEITFGSTTSFSLPNLLNTYGQPGEVWLSTYSTEYPAGVLPFLAALFYPDRGILAIYGPLQADIVGEVVRACNWDNPPSMFGLWSPDQEMSFIDAARHFRLNPDEPGFLLLPLEEATNIDTQTFYEIFMASGNSECLETPIDIWPSQQ